MLQNPLMFDLPLDYCFSHFVLCPSIPELPLVSCQERHISTRWSDQEVEND